MPLNQPWIEPKKTLLTGVEDNDVVSEKVTGDLVSCAKLTLGMYTSTNVMTDNIMRVNFISRTR